VSVDVTRLRRSSRGDGTDEAVSVGLPEDPCYFGVEAKVRRRTVPGVHLEVLRDRIHVLAEDLRQRRAGRFGR